MLCEWEDEEEEAEDKHAAAADGDEEVPEDAKGTKL